MVAFCPLLYLGAKRRSKYMILPFVPLYGIAAATNVGFGFFQLITSIDKYYQWIPLFVASKEHV